MPLNFCFKDRVQLNFQSSTLCVSDNSSQSSGFPHLRRYSCPPSTAHDPQEQNLKSCTVQLSITSLHFLHRITFLTIFIMHVTRSQLSEFTSFFEPQIISKLAAERRFADAPFLVGKRNNRSHGALPWKLNPDEAETPVRVDKNAVIDCVCARPVAD